jgi:aconitate hydratase
MRARAGDPPRTMPQKILAGRAADPQLRGDLVQVKVDQVLLSRAPNRAFAEALAAGLKKTPLEVAIAYDGTCVTDAPWNLAAQQGHPLAVSHEMLAHGLLVARPGIGYPAPVHLERFASPARLALTDDPRLAPLGGVGMLVLVVSPGQLGQALAQGTVWLRPPRSVQILLSGKTRPFVCARDVALELIRRGIGEAVRRIEAQHKAPVVLEFAGTSAKLLNVSERAVLASIAPLVGAQAGLFLSDEKTESFLRDQRRSKAHRTLFADQGAPCDEAITLDLATVDPLLIDEVGQIRPVRDLAGKPVTQAILGGDSGVTLRDMMAAAALLKSKRVPPRLDFLVAPPSRQVFEVMAQSGALADLAATGARIIEPDRRTMLGEMYTPAPGRLSMRTCDPEPLTPGFLVASAETLAYTVATGAVGDPRGFKRPVRVTIPRMLPTDDVLVLRERRAEASSPKRPIPSAAPPVPWKTPVAVDLAWLPEPPRDDKAPKEDKTAPKTKDDKELPRVQGVVALHLDAVRSFLTQAIEGRTGARVLIAPILPTSIAHALAGLGIAPCLVDEAGLQALQGQRSVTLPAPAQWVDALPITTAKGKGTLTLQAVGVERSWLGAGTPRTAPPAAGKRGG